MKKSLIGPILSVIVIVLVGAMFVYFYVSLNRMEQKLLTIQTAIADDAGKINAIVGFFNANSNAQTNQK
ncbi:MAG: hypothetical protein WC453_00935 [Patescibacteria group bacterium]